MFAFGINKIIIFDMLLTYIQEEVTSLEIWKQDRLHRAILRVSKAMSPSKSFSLFVHLTNSQLFGQIMFPSKSLSLCLQHKISAYWAKQCLHKNLCHFLFTLSNSQLFGDNTDSSASPLSLHCLVGLGAGLGRRAGDWWVDMLLLITRGWMWCFLSCWVFQPY